MRFFPNEWSLKHQELNKIIRKKESFNEAVSLIFELHKYLHRGQGYHNHIDDLLNDLRNEEISKMPTKRDETIAWAIWHITRIEDMTMNVLVARQEEIFNSAWKARMNSLIDDTANALSDDEIIAFSKNVNFNELLLYRDEVGKKSQEIISNLSSMDMKRKVSQDDIQRIYTNGGVTNHPNSIWLLDFWGKKDVAGLILMPLTRHQTLHLNDCYKWKQSMR